MVMKIIFFFVHHILKILFSYRCFWTLDYYFQLPINIEFFHCKKTLLLGDLMWHNRLINLNEAGSSFQDYLWNSLKKDPSVFDSPALTFPMNCFISIEHTDGLSSFNWCVRLIRTGNVSNAKQTLTIYDRWLCVIRDGTDRSTKGKPYWNWQAVQVQLDTS